MSEIQEPHWRDLPPSDLPPSDPPASGLPEGLPEGNGSDPAGPTGDADAALEAFWQEARTRARFDWIGAYAGPTVLGSLRPPAWSFGATPEEADTFVADVLAESEVSTAGALSDYEAEGVLQPEVGGVSIVLDGAGFPRALVATAAVSVLPLSELEEEDVAVPVEGDDLTPDTPFVVERLTLLYPTKRHR